MSKPAAMTAGEAFALLGLSSPSTPEAVKAAFNAAAKAARPDREGGDPERFRRVIEAYRLLQRLQAARSALSAPTTPPAEKAEPDPRAPVLDIRLTEALEGVKRKVRVSDGRAFDVRLPAGLRTGDTVRLKGRAKGGGDLLMTVKITPEPDRSVVGDDVWLTVPVDPRVLRDGGRIEVSTPGGARTVWVPRGLPGGGRLRLKGEGLPPRGGRRRGHLFLKLQPSEAAAAQSAARSLLRRFASAWTEGARAAARL